MSMGGTYTGSSSQNTRLIELLKKNGFATGGTIGSLVKKTGEDGFILARSGEEVLSIPKLELASGMVDQLIDFASLQPPLNKVSQIRNNEKTINNDVNMQIVLPNVKDYEQFEKELLRSKKFESVVQSITFDKVTGRNSLKKFTK